LSSDHVRTERSAEEMWLRATIPLIVRESLKLRYDDDWEETVPAPVTEDELNIHILLTFIGHQRSLPANDDLARPELERIVRFRVFSWSMAIRWALIALAGFISGLSPVLAHIAVFLPSFLPSF
jgi:hypothetical protein